MNMTSPVHCPVNLESRPRVAIAACGAHQKSSSRYHLPKLWCLHLYNYHGELLVNGDSFPIRPRHASILPPGADLQYILNGSSVHLFAHFHLPKAADSSFQAPAMLDLEGNFEAIYRDFERAIELFPRYPTCTDVTVWKILWALNGVQQKKSENLDSRHPALDQAIEIIERRLHEAISGEELARAVQLSQHHLIRLFRQTIGTTPAKYIRRRRVQRAQHLLLHSTLSIKAIAFEVGIPDLHLFNKTIRQILGRAPSAIRRAGK